MPLYRLSNKEVNEILKALSELYFEVDEAPINEGQDLDIILDEIENQMQELELIVKIQHKLYKKIKE